MNFKYSFMFSTPNNYFIVTRILPFLTSSFLWFWSSFYDLLFFPSLYLEFLFLFLLFSLDFDLFYSFLLLDLDFYFFSLCSFLCSSFSASFFTFFYSFCWVFSIYFCYLNYFLNCSIFVLSNCTPWLSRIFKSSLKFNPGFCSTRLINSSLGFDKNLESFSSFLSFLF